MKTAEEFLIFHTSRIGEAAKKQATINAMNDFAAQESERVNAELKIKVDTMLKVEYELRAKLSAAEQALETEALSFKSFIDDLSECDLKYYEENEEGFKSDVELYNLYKNRNK